MAQYLIQASFTAEGVRGLLNEGGSSRRSHAQEFAEGLGGSLEAFYFAFGSDDVVAIISLPDNVAMAALSLAFASGGAVRARTTVLMTPEEMDQASRMTVDYRPALG